MIQEFKIAGVSYKWDTNVFFDLSIPLIFNGAQPNSYNVDKASSKAYEVDDFIGDTRQGGGCNFEVISLIPHCNGTHTECIGHITLDRYSIHQQLKDVFVKASLISVTPEKSTDTLEHYSPDFAAEDMVITRRVLVTALKKTSVHFLEAIIIRTLPNSADKKSRQYMKEQPPFFSLEAMELLVSLGVKHLLVDIPSLDRTFDEGELSAHHVFWNIAQNTHIPDQDAHFYKTITEMIFVPDEISDGKYLLNLQIAAFAGDAAPSRPVIFKLL